MAIKRASNTYKNGDISAIGWNSVAFIFRDFVTKSGGYLVKATAGSVIDWTAKETVTMAADNTTVAKAKVVYEPPKAGTTLDIPVIGQKITFAWAIVADNVINLKVNGVAMTPVTYAVGNDETLEAIATQLETDFPTIIYSATRTTTRIIEIVPYGLQDSVVISDIVVTLGGGQTTGVASNNVLAQADEGKFYDISTVTHYVNLLTAHATSGQVKLEKFISSTKGKFSIQNT